MFIQSKKLEVFFQRLNPRLNPWDWYNGVIASRLYYWQQKLKPHGYTLVHWKNANIEMTSATMKPKRIVLELVMQSSHKKINTYNLTIA